MSDEMDYTDKELEARVSEMLRGIQEVAPAVIFYVGLRPYHVGTILSLPLSGEVSPQQVPKRLRELAAMLEGMHGSPN